MGGHIVVDAETLSFEPHGLERKLGGQKLHVRLDSIVAIEKSDRAGIRPPSRRGSASWFE
jgi:hypothetical protein